MKMQFGQYKGVDIKDVPEDYLEFILNQAEITCAIVPKELERRKKELEATSGKATEQSG